MRWTIGGAESLLHLRCATENSDWQDFNAFRRRQRHAKLYLLPYPDPTTPIELTALDSPADLLASAAA